MKNISKEFVCFKKFQTYSECVFYDMKLHTKASFRNSVENVTFLNT